MSIIKTASWWTPLPDDHLRIGISRGTPRFGKIGKGYRMYRKLQPGPWFSIPDSGEWERRYRAEVLAQLDASRVHDELMVLANGRVPVLCCFEKAGGPSWCHRSLVSAWLSDALGQPVPEFGFEDLPQDRHPLRPPELLI